MSKLSLSPNGIFRTVQGEGALIGTPMTFIRLAGCSVGCANCDTDYSVAERLEPRDIAYRVVDLLGTDGVCEWVWITGGEPTDHDLNPLQDELRRISPNLRLALATAGHKWIRQVYAREHWDWISVSPHNATKWEMMTGKELKVVPGLNSIKLSDIEDRLSKCAPTFSHYFVQPLEGDAQSLKDCLDWVQRKHEHSWRITIQAHKVWNVA